MDEGPPPKPLPNVGPNLILIRHNGKYLYDYDPDDSIETIRKKAAERAQRAAAQAPDPKDAKAPLAYHGDNPVLLYINSAGSKSGQQVLDARTRKLLAVLTGRDKISQSDTWDYSWHKIKPTRVQSLRNQLERFIEEGLYAPSYCNALLCTLKGILRRCYDADLISYERLHRLSNVRGFTVSSSERQSRAPEVSARDIHRLLQHLPLSAPRTARDHVFLLLLWQLGLRCCEITALDVCDYDRQQKKLHIRGKGKKYRYEKLSKPLCDAIDAWLSHRKKTSGPLLTKLHKGGPLDNDKQIVYRRMQPRALGKTLYKLQERAGIKRRFTPHDLRRLRITDMLRHGHDISTVARLVGHASPTTTARYDCRKQREIEAASIKDQQRTTRALKDAAKAAMAKRRNKSDEKKTPKSSR